MASFLGATTIREAGLEAWGWLALGCLVAGLVAAAVLLAPWRLKFAVDAQQLYDELYEQAAAEAEADTLGWLASPGRRPFRSSCRRPSVPWTGSPVQRTTMKQLPPSCRP